MATPAIAPLYVFMTLGVALCVISNLGSGVISSILMSFTLAGEAGLAPDWIIGGYTNVMFAMFYVGYAVRLVSHNLSWFDRLLSYRPGFRRYIYGLARFIYPIREG